MRHPFPLARAAVLLAGAALLPGCTDRSVSAPVDRPAFSFTNGPDNPGASGVVRFGDRLIVRLDYFPDPGLIVRHYPSDDSFEVCGGSQQAPVVEEQFVSDPNAINGVIVLLRKTGEVPVLMYPEFLDDKPFCDHLRDDWLFKGTGRLRYHDNNLFFDPSRTNAFSWRGEGTVVDRSGKKFNYTEEQSFVVDPESFAIHVERVKLRLVPR